MLFFKYLGLVTFIALVFPFAALAQATAGDVFTSPDVWAQLTGLAVTLASLGVTVLTGLASIYLPSWVNAYLDGKAQKNLHEAAMTYAENAMTLGLDVANAKVAKDFGAYANDSVPGALLRLKPSTEVLIAIARRYLKAR